jgi:hypothetical protein
MTIAGVTVRSLKVETEQRLGVRRTQVEPPVTRIDREAIEIVE